jgi:DNA-binding NtrC family response regulator
MQLPILFCAPSGVRARAVADLLARDHDVLRTADLAVALRECRRRPPALAVLPFTGAATQDEVLTFLREPGRRTAVFLYAEIESPPPEAVDQALAAGARGLLDASAPHFGADLCRRLTRLLADLRQRRAEDRARSRLFARHDIAGASPAMQDVFRRAIRASQLTEVPVLIEGEAGTPKRRLASAILALDDIGSLHPGLQSILCGVLGQQPAEFRVIAASQYPAQQLLADGALHDDLFACLAQFRIPLPPLRGRPEDIEAQTHHVLEATAGRKPSARTHLGAGVMAALRRLPWEGNTAQLEDVLRRSLAARSSAVVLSLDDLPAWVRVDPAGPLPQPVPHPGDYLGREGEAACVTDREADAYERCLLRTLPSGQDTAVVPDHELGPVP